MLGPKKDEYKECSLLNKAQFWFQSAEDSQFYQALRYQNGSKGLVWHYNAMSSNIWTFFSGIKNLISTAKKIENVLGFDSFEAWKGKKAALGWLAQP